MMEIPIGRLPELSIGAPRLLFDAAPFYTGWSESNDVAPDGRLLMLNNVEDGQVLTHIVVVEVENWFEELKRLAPADK